MCARNARPGSRPASTASIQRALAAITDAIEPLEALLDGGLVTAAIAALNRRTFASLAHRNYRLYFVGQVVSVTGTWMQNIAMAWLILELTHSPVAVGALALCQFLPFTVFGLFAGVIVDRLDARRLVIGTQAASMVLAAALAVLTLLGLVEPWVVYLLAGLRGTVLVLDAPSRQALTYRMVGPRELPNAVALNSSLFNGARIVGPALGGIVVALAGAGFCFAFNAVSFLAVLAGLLAMRANELLPGERAEIRPRILAGTREALALRAPHTACRDRAHARRRRQHVRLQLQRPAAGARQEHAARGPGDLRCHHRLLRRGCPRRRADRRHPRPGEHADAARSVWPVSASPSLLLAPLHTAPATGLMLFLVGLSFTMWTANANSTLQLEAPGHLRGRVIGLYYYAFNGAGPVGGSSPAGWPRPAGPGSRSRSAAS